MIVNVILFHIGISVLSNCLSTSYVCQFFLLVLNILCLKDIKYILFLIGKADSSVWYLKKNVMVVCTISCSE